MWFVELHPIFYINIFSHVLVNTPEFEHANHVCTEMWMNGYLAPFVAYINSMFVKGVEEHN